MRKSIINLKINLPIYCIENDSGNKVVFMSPIQKALTEDTTKKHGLKFIKIMAETELLINLCRIIERQKQILERD